MTMKKAVTAWFDIVGDGVSTSVNIDLASDPVSFTAGLGTGRNTFFPNTYVNRELTVKFDPTIAPSSIFAAWVDYQDYSIVSTSLSGTVVTVTFSAAIPSYYAVRVGIELLY